MPNRINAFFFHGWGVNSGVFDNLQQNVTAPINIVGVDLPGFGERNNFSIEEKSIKEIARLVATDLPEQSIVAGWSLGGLVAQQIAISYPEKIKLLIMICSSPYFCLEDDWPGTRKDIFEQFERTVARDPSKSLDRFLAIQALGSESAKRDIKTLKQLIASRGLPSPSALAEGLRLLRETDLRSQLSASQVPTVRIYGDRDSLVPVAAIKAVENLCPMTSSEVIENASHAPFISHPEQFLQILDKYLT